MSVRLNLGKLFLFLIFPAFFLQTIDLVAFMNHDALDSAFWSNNVILYLEKGIAIMSVMEFQHDSVSLWNFSMNKFSYGR